MKEVIKYTFYWFCTFIIIVLTLLLLVALFSSPVTVPRHKFPTEVKGQVIDIKVNNETHQYLQYRAGGFRNSFQLTHWQGCKYCKEKEQTLNKK